MVTAKLRQYAHDLRARAGKGESLAVLRAAKEQMIKEIHRIVTIILGAPPTTFDCNNNNNDEFDDDVTIYPYVSISHTIIIIGQYLDKDKNYKTVTGLTPQSFYLTHVAPHVNFAQTVSLINDPRNTYNKHYTVQHLGNVWGGKAVSYVNVEIGQLKKYAIASIKAGKAVWFGCDVGKFLDRKAGVMALDTFDYQLAFGTSFRELDKAGRLRFAESLMTHAMVFTGVHLESDGGLEKSVRWRVENSWGDENGDKGYYSMTDAWFDEFMYQVVIDKSLVSPDLLKILEEKAIELPPWDPMGSLA